MRPTQRRLARHALGLPNRQMRSYRNRFVAAYCAGDYDKRLAMVDAGLAEKGPRDGPYVRFWLTRAGVEAALEPGETLDPEDFP